MNRQLNNNEQIQKIKEKIKKVNLMLYISGQNELSKWRRFYLFL